MTAYLISLALVGLDCHRRIGGMLVSAEIIQFIPRPKRDDAANGFSDNCVPLCRAGSEDRSRRLQGQTSMPDVPAEKT